MIWWHWILLGLMLAAIELLTPGGFFFLFFAIAALLLGALEVSGLLANDALQWGLFSVLSIASLVFFRKPLLEWMDATERTDVDSLVGELAMPAGAIVPGGHGRAELRGSMWNVRNIDDAHVAPGERCRVVAVRGLELDIRPERTAHG
jgi:membrane protein implicated in regulation of membrane protease activity